MDESEALVPDAPLEQKMDPPPPYPNERWWKKYQGERNVYCCSECMCRTGCLPCLCGACILSCFTQACYCLYLMSGNEVRECPRCEELRPADICTPFDEVLNWWPVCCIGVLRFPEERSADEKQRIQQCDDMCDKCLTCPCRTCASCCDAFCNTKCVLGIKHCWSACSFNVGTCVFGFGSFMNLVYRRLCHPRQQMQ